MRNVNVSIGRDILERQEREGWGAKVIEKLANDLRAEFKSDRRNMAVFGLIGNEIAVMEGKK